MCSIIGVCGPGLAYEEVEKALAKTISRGPDDSRILQSGAGWLGFNRLSIMGLTEEGMQPFVYRNKSLVCNGEIYGFRPIKEELICKGYVFQSDSDCEILPALYEEQGTDMFAMLDAEFAMVLYDAEKDTWIAARDPIGIRPLYYGILENGTYVFASEPKNLVGLTARIDPFPR